MPPLSFRGLLQLIVYALLIYIFQKPVLGGLGLAGDGISKTSSNLAEVGKKVSYVYGVVKDLADDLSTRAPYLVFKDSVQNVPCFGAQRKMYWANLKCWYPEDFVKEFKYDPRQKNPRNKLK